MRRLLAGLSIVWLAGCESEGGAPSAPAAGSGSAVAKAAAGGFSADLAKDLAEANASGAGSAKPAAGSGEPAKPAAGSAEPAKPAAGSAVEPSAGSGSAAGAPAAGSGSAKPADAKPADAPKPGEGSAKVADAPKPADVPKPGEGSAKVADAPKPAEPAPPVNPKHAAFAAGPIIQSATAIPRKVAVPAELAAIKLSLLPNWDRDVHDAGTISLAVRIPGRTDSAVFVFRYGYEEAGAPADRDAYKKWLGERKVLTVKQDRQAGAAWYLEGADGAGRPSFRVVVMWGSRRLVCYGALFRDAESSKLGDLRDQTILQAKQICETVAL